MFVQFKVGFMQRLIIDQDIRPMSEFRSGVASFIKQVHDTKRPLVITQHGKGVGVLLGVPEYEAMQEKIELLEDIQTSITQLNEGQGVSHKEAKKLVFSRLIK
jgi:prevent-host-death family protein